MRFHNFIYLLKQGGRSIFSNKLMSFASIGVLVACFLLIGGAVLTSLSVGNIVQYVENQNEVVAFLEDGVTEDDRTVISLAINNLDNIGKVEFISKEEALEKERQAAGEFASLWDGLEDSNPYPDAYIIQIRDISLMEETVEEIVNISGVDKVNAQTDVAAILGGLRTTVNYAGAVVVIILIVVSVIIITNTIKLTVFSRRREINIMKYVGATDSFIRMPFLVEGMLIGLIAAILAFLMLGVFYTYLLQWAGENYGMQLGVILNSAVQFGDVALYIFSGFAAIGCFIGAMGSGVFIRRYLKV